MFEEGIVLSFIHSASVAHLTEWGSWRYYAPDFETGNPIFGTIAAHQERGIYAA
jgi:hypothetical protein